MSSYPSFTLLSEVVTHLNASGPDSNGNYLVYGLTISSNSVQAFVDHANTYIGSLVPSVTSTDPRYQFAQLAASGGMLLGAADSSALRFEMRIFQRCLWLQKRFPGSVRAQGNKNSLAVAEMFTVYFDVSVSD